jgi:MFS family permease
MPRPDWLNRNVTGMTLTSFFSDACYEMVVAILPGFLPVVGIAAAALGWIEGFSDAFSSFLKLASGWWSDRIGRRKPVVVIGYLFTGSGLSLCAFAHSWPMILLARMVSWFGKGIRGSLRNTMLSESVPPEVRGKAFGFHRAGDTAGAIAGPLAGIWLLSILPHQPPDHAFRTVFLLSLIPGLAAPIAFLLLVKETLHKPGEKQRLWTAVRALPKPYFRFLTAVGLFGAGDFSPTLLILAASTLLAPRYGAIRAAQIAAFLYILRNIIYALGAFPVGALADRFRKTTLLAGGYCLGGLTALAAAAAFTRNIDNILLLAVIFIVAGLFAAAQDTLEGAIPPDLVPDAPKGGTAYGLLGAVNGVGDLVASAMVGTLWTVVSPQLAFGAAAFLMLIGARLMARRA